MSSIVQKSFETGAVIFRQGDTSADMYHILSGRVGIFLPRAEGDLLLSELGPGSLFGEMALINGPPRTATATALEPVKVNLIPEDVFRQNTLGLPEWSLSIARVLADRLKNITLSLDKLEYDQTHSAALPGASTSNSISIVPQTLEILYYPETDSSRLYLAGMLDAASLDELENRINALRRQNVSPVILNFSNVIDAQRKALASLVEMARSSTEATGQIRLENVQFIAEKLKQHQGFQSIVHTSQTPVQRVGYGEFLMRQGEAGTQMYVVKTGSFAVTRNVGDKEVVLWTAEEGDVLGEMSLISGGTRSASVQARRSSQVYVIDLAEFQRNAYHIPRWFMGIIEGLVSRLRETNKKLDDFVSGSLHPQALSELLGFEIYENVKSPGSCRFSGAFTEANLPSLRTYVRRRLKQGVREFRWDVTQVRSVDPEAARFLVKLQRYLAQMSGSLLLKGANRSGFPSEFQPPVA